MGSKIMNEELKEVFEKQQKKKIQGEDNTFYDDTLQAISFMVGSEEFAVPILNVKEIIKPMEYTRVPGTPNYVMGVFNLRGGVFPLINLRLKFGLSAIKQDQDTRYLVVTYKDEVAGFVIDKLNEAVRINQSDIDPVPETIGEGENFMQGIGKREDRLITILRVENLLKKAF